MAAATLRTAATFTLALFAPIIVLVACSPPAPGSDAGDAGNGTDSSVTPGDDGGCTPACATVANGANRCVAGACLMSCNEGFADCDLMASNGCEVDVRSSATNCGMCGRSCGGMGCSAGTCGCPMGRVACGMACVDVGTDRMNCGDCGRACPGESICQSGLCVCTAPQVACPGVGCRDLATDAMHCGSCARACAAGQTCMMGMCR